MVSAPGHVDTTQPWIASGSAPHHRPFVAGDEDLTDEELSERQEEFADEIVKRLLIEDWYGARRADIAKVEVPLLPAANLGGDGRHLRGNLGVFMGASSKQKWLELHGEEHWTHFCTDYRRKLQLEFLDHFLKGANNGWDRRPPVLLNVRQVDDTFVARTEEAWPILPPSGRRCTSTLRRCPWAGYRPKPKQR